MKELILKKNNFAECVQACLEVLKKGGTVVYPTETSYGLGCDYYNEVAMNRIYAIKKRDKNKPVSVLVPDLTYALSLVRIPEKARRVILEGWPGPLTAILPFKHCNWKEHCDDYLGMRVSSHPFASQLVLNLGHPLVTTSANISGLDDCYTARQIRQSFKNGVGPDLFINAGTLPKVKPSTAVKFHENGEVEILRQGSVKVKI